MLSILIEYIIVNIIVFRLRIQKYINIIFFKINNSPQSFFFIENIMCYLKHDIYPQVYHKSRAELERSDRNVRLGIRGLENKTIDTYKRIRLRRTQRTIDHRTTKNVGATTTVQFHRGIQRELKKRRHWIS